MQGFFYHFVNNHYYKDVIISSHSLLIITLQKKYINNWQQVLTYAHFAFLHSEKDIICKGARNEIMIKLCGLDYHVQVTSTFTICTHFYFVHATLHDKTLFGY